LLIFLNRFDPKASRSHIHLTLIPAVGSEAQKLPLYRIDLGSPRRAFSWRDHDAVGHATAAQNRRTAGHEHSLNWLAALAAG
jgi:hypothetical protein